ncbi:uncharacterized protein LOC116260828 [Nymphaea colorata]|nr:uncharacterized protein LOC116260828 [Nymphaea colorata]
MKRERGGGTGANLASCLVATIFLIFFILVLLVVFFTLFRPENPTISVSTVQVPTFSISNGTLSFTLSIFAAVHNPNRASAFDHYDSTALLLYSGNQLGFMFIPAGGIDARRTQLMTITFSVKGFPLGSIGLRAATTVAAVPTTIEVEARMRMTGRVKVLHFFTHHAETTVDCRIAIDSRDGTVLGFHC